MSGKAIHPLKVITLSGRPTRQDRGLEEPHDVLIRGAMSYALEIDDTYVYISASTTSRGEAYYTLVLRPFHHLLSLLCLPTSFK